MWRRAKTSPCVSLSMVAVVAVVVMVALAALIMVDLNGALTGRRLFLDLLS